VYEWAGKSSDVEIHVPKGATGATVTNLMEKPEGSALKLTAIPLRLLFIRMRF
jgi:alpha-mannosidase